MSARADPNSAGHQPMVDPAGLLKPRRLFSFEKWYFDGQTTEGDFFLAYLAPLTLAGSKGAELVVCLFPANGEAFRRSYHIKGGDLDLADHRQEAAFPGGRLTLNPQQCRLVIDREGAAVDVTYRPMDAAWSPPEDGVVLRMGTRCLRWVVPVPRARVEGEVRVDAGAVRFHGLGYSDFVQTDISPWRLPLRELLWGRALGEETLVIWNRVGFAQGHAALGLVGGSAGEPWLARQVEPDFLLWAPHEPTAGHYPVELGLALSPDPQGSGDAVGAQITLQQTRLLLGEYVADVQGFRSGFERWLYRAFTGNPVEYKLLSRVNNKDATALAAHEWVLWGRGRDRG